MVAENGKLFGTILDAQTEKPLEKVIVILEPCGFGAESNQKGYYSITNIPSGKYRMQVVLIGYRSIKDQIVHIESNIEKRINLSIEPVILSSSDSILITATRGPSLVAEIPSSVDIVNNKRITSRIPQNIAEVLQDVPGLFIKDYGGVSGLKTISLRGASTEQVLILMDGQRLNNAQNGQVDLGLISVQGVERIEVVRGANSALYGADAVGGVVNILLKSKRPEQVFTVLLTIRWDLLTHTI